MSFEAALRATEVLLALALIQSSAEHMFGPLRQWALFAPRLGGAVMLGLGVYVPWVLAGLCLHMLALLARFDGPYNGGSDRMGSLILVCLTVVAWAPDGPVGALFMGYIAIQLTLSYFISGWVKLTNADWRRGHALRDVFAFSAYPVSAGLRELALKPTLLRSASWGVITLEVLFPLTLLHPVGLSLGLMCAGAFHIANALLFGLNRFVWVWLAGYPALLWLQTRVGQAVWG